MRLAHTTLLVSVATTLVYGLAPRGRQASHHHYPGNRRGAQQLTLWPDGGPVEQDIVETPFVLRQEVAAVLYAVTKCRHERIADLFLATPQKATQEYLFDTTMSVSLFDKDHIRQYSVGSLKSFVDGPVWPILSQTGLDNYTSVTGSPLPPDLGGLLQVVSGLPTSTYTREQYTEDTLSFAITRSNESPVVIQAGSEPVHLSAGAMYAIKNPGSEPDDTTQLWSGPIFSGEQIEVANVSFADLIQDIESVSHVTDFKRWKPGAFGPCYNTEGMIWCVHP